MEEWSTTAVLWFAMDTFIKCIVGKNQSTNSKWRTVNVIITPGAYDNGVLTASSRNGEGSIAEQPCQTSWWMVSPEQTQTLPEWAAGLQVLTWDILHHEMNGNLYGNGSPSSCSQGHVFFLLSPIFLLQSQGLGCPRTRSPGGHLEETWLLVLRASSQEAQMAHDTLQI